MAPSRSRPEFFVDRSLGGHDVARALRHAGWKIHTHLEVYGARDQRVEDVEWLELCGKRGWGALTMDRRIRYRPAEIAAIRRHRVKLFALTSGNLTATEQAERYSAMPLGSTLRARLPVLSSAQSTPTGSFESFPGRGSRAQKRSASLRRAVLERAFRGELVPQDPTDEPAEALLARIRAERAA